MSMTTNRIQESPIFQALLLLCMIVWFLICAGCEQAQELPPPKSPQWAEELMNPHPPPPPPPPPTPTELDKFVKEWRRQFSPLIVTDGEVPGNCSAEVFDLGYSSEAQAKVISPDQEFHGYHIRDRQALDVWTTWALIQLLKSPDTYYLDGMLCVEPGMGFRIRWGSKCKDFHVQLNCLHVSVYDEAGQKEQLELSMTGRWALVALYNDLFPRHRIKVWSKEE